MARHRASLPQLSTDLFLTDGGLETTLVFHQGIELPDFASFPLLDRPGGRERLRDYYRTYARLAREHDLGAVFDSVTWRASADWGRGLGYEPEALDGVNRRAIDLLAELRDELGEGPPLVISGCVGPRADGYRPGGVMSADEAERYHRDQIGVLAQTEADLVSALTLNYVEEAIGIARAAEAAAMPLALSFTVETDGRLPTGQSLGEAIGAVDEATDSAPAYYMLNCAHPAHFADALLAGERWTERIRGLRVNASRLSHAELDEATELDAGDPAELGAEVAALRERMAHLNVLGGCCGTDHRHVGEIARACLARA